MSSKEEAEKALKIVEQQYTAFANTINDWDFFRGLAQYTKTVQEMMPTKAIVEELEKQRELAIKPYMTLSKTSWEEFVKAGEEVIKIVKSINEQQEKYNILLPETMTEIHLQLTGNIFTDDPLKLFNNNLLEVATRIKALGFGDTIKKFEDATKTRVYANYTFSPTYEKAEYEKMTLERQQETEVWGAWIELPDIEKVVLEPEELNKQARKDLENTQGGKNIKKTKPHLFANFQTFPVQEMDRIRLGKKEAEKSAWFKTSKYKDYLKRIHIHITTELIKADTEQEKQTEQISITEEIIETDIVKSKPFLLKEGKNGYFKFYKQGPKIEVGKITGKKYKLLELFLDPLGTARTIDSIFEILRTPKDNLDNRLKDSYLANGRKIELIQFAVKELQKTKGLKGKITLEIHQNKTHALLRLKL